MNAGCDFGTTVSDIEGIRNGDGRYRLTFELSVEDGALLWDAAAAKFREGIGLSLAEVMETIGPREDPSIEDCLITVALPEGIEGCALNDFDLTRIDSERTHDEQAGRGALSVRLKGYAPFQAPFHSPDPLAL